MEQLVKWRDWYQQRLLEQIIPFWTERVDTKHGGIYTCIDDDGKKVTGDKWMWSQFRALWVFSKLSNSFPLHPDKTKWLSIGKGIFDFATTTAAWSQEDQGWNLCLSEEGAILRGCESVYVDAFAIYGLVEYFKATGSSEVAKLAFKPMPLYQSLIKKACLIFLIRFQRVQNHRAFL
eukprot:m.68715 g.68715  ORF g.68715 m.68715 type:complete len:177 (+) comp19919_c0_seq2:21-551(+)